MKSFGRKRKRKDRVSPGFFFLSEFLEDLESGNIPEQEKKLRHVAFIVHALKAIVNDRIDPAVALYLIPSSLPGFYPRSDAAEVDSQYRVINEVFPVWHFLAGHFVPIKVPGSVYDRAAKLGTSIAKSDLPIVSEGKSGSRKKIVAAAAIKFLKSERVIDRYLSAYRLYYAEFLHVTDELTKLYKIEGGAEMATPLQTGTPEGDAKWEREDARVKNRVEALLNNIAATVFGRPKKSYAKT